MDRRRTRWLEPLIIALGLTSIAGCRGDDGDTENATDDASESAESTGDGDTTTTTTTTTSTTDTTTTDTTGDGDTSCTPGELGCECSGGLCLGDLECTNGICSDPNCLPGELACECNNGLCLGDLVCEGGVCLEDGGTTDTTTDTGMECPNANEMVCDGGCVDVLVNNDNCGDCGTVCKVYTFPDPDIGTCQDGGCTPTYSDCVAQADGFVNCDQICGAEGKICVEEGCNGDTSITTGTMQACMAANPNGVSHTPQACGTAISWAGDPYGACCCAQ